MAYTFAEKALARAAGLDRAAAGDILDIRPDLVLSHDNTAAIAQLFYSLGQQRIRHPERLAITLDHAVPAPTAQHAQNHADVRRFVADQGIEHFFEAGRGICHQVLSEEALVLPGQTILGADSHTTHFGWLGAFGAGIGRSEVAALWATGELWVRVPETIRIELTGRLPDGVTAKDLGLHLLRLLGSDVGIYRALEIAGPGLSTLSVEGRMVIPNLMAESGVKNCYLVPDEAIFDWLGQRLAQRDGRSRQKAAAQVAGTALFADPDASYTFRHTVDLAILEPSVACPHDPANVVPLSQVAGIRVHQAFIGTCTNGRLEDLAAAAAVLRPEGEAGGQVHTVAPGTRLLIIPASSQVLQAALAAGYIETFLAAGAMIGTPGCGPCMGNHLGIPASGEIVISSANRNFRGRMGNPDSAVYLASPAVVAASAVAGYIADPRHVTAAARETSYGISGSVRPEALARGQEATGVTGATPLSYPAPQEPTRRPTIGGPKSGPGGHAGEQPPSSRMLVQGGQAAGLGQPSIITGRAWKYGDNVNTDVIFPGKYTYTVQEQAEMARHALEDLDPSFASNVQPGDIIGAGHNWGTGSSREQAVTALRAAGVRAIIAASFARIYFRNAVNNGLLPIECPEAVPMIEPGETITLDLGGSFVRCAAGEYPFTPFSAAVRRIIEAGGLLEMLRAAPGPETPAVPLNSAQSKIHSGGR
jgi:homoaconitate hydratase family protein/3-isopropylmalate dehydratase small subunit